MTHSTEWRWRKAYDGLCYVMRHPMHKDAIYAATVDDFGCLVTVAWTLTPPYVGRFGR